MRHVLDHVRSHGRDKETLNVIYIVDDKNKLIDDLRIREILLSPLHAHVSDLMDNKCVSLSVTDDKKNGGRRLPKVRPHRAAGRGCTRSTWRALSPWTTSWTWPRKRRRGRSRNSAVWRLSMIRT